MQYPISNRQILRLAAPISLSILIPQISFMANAIFLGRLGKMELVVNGLTSIFYLLLSYVGFGLSNGILVLLSRRVGERDIKGLCRTFANSILLSVAMAACIILLTTWLAPVLFRNTIHEENIYFKTIDYLFLRMWGLPFLMLTQLVNSFFISVGRSRYLIYGALTANLLNILLDYLLIFGKYGFPSMGLKGAAVASIIAELAFCIVMYTIFFGKRNYRKYPVLKYLKFDWGITKQMMKVSAPLIVQYLFGIGGWQLFYIYVEHLGVTQLAASHILRSVLGIVSIGTWALASTCNSMVSNLIGQGKTASVMDLVRKIMTISFLYTLCISVLLFVFPHTFMRFYTDKNEIVLMGISSLRILAISSLIMSMATICFNAVVGSGNTLVNLCIETFCVTAYIVYVTIIVEKWRMPLHYAWASEFVYWGCLLTVSGIYLLSGRWKNKVI